jgi:hypothetical protein
MANHELLDQCLEANGLENEPESLLFPVSIGKTAKLSRRQLARTGLCGYAPETTQARIGTRGRELHPLDIRFERPTARLLGARRHEVAPRLGLAPRSFRVTGERITLILPRNKKSGRASRYRPECLFVPSEADFFLPHARWRIAEGFHPKPLTREFHLFSRQVPPAAAFTIHRVVPTAGLHQRPSASQAAALSAPATRE